MSAIGVVSPTEGGNEVTPVVSESHLLNIRVEHIKGTISNLGRLAQQRDHRFRGVAPKESLQSNTMFSRESNGRSVHLTYQPPTAMVLHEALSPQSRGNSHFDDDVPWPAVLMYALPPIPMILKLLQRIRHLKALVIVMAAGWPCHH